MIKFKLFINLILISILLNDLVNSFPTGSSFIQKNNNETNNQFKQISSILTKRSSTFNLDDSPIANFLSSKSFKFDKTDLNEFNKRNDVNNRIDLNLLRKKIHEIANNLLNLSPISSKSLLTTTRQNSIINNLSLFKILNDPNYIDSNREEEEIVRRSLALGLNLANKIKSNQTIQKKSNSIKNNIENIDKDDNSSDLDDEDETLNKKKDKKKQSKVNSSFLTSMHKKKSSIKKKKVKNDEDEDEKKDEDEEEDEENNNRLSQKQLKQVYKFLKKKNNLFNQNTDDANSLVSSLLLSPNQHVHLKLRDSLSAKAANDALLKWHSKNQFASLNDLEEMYNKFYEFYYDYFDRNNFNYFPHHHHHHHQYTRHHHHDHHHLNLLEFLASKNGNSDDFKKDHKSLLFKKILNQNYITPKFNPWDDYNHFLTHDDLHHHHHHYRHVLPSYYKMKQLRSKLNYYLSNDLEPPIELLNEIQNLEDNLNFSNHENNFIHLPFHHEYYNSPTGPYPHHHYHYTQRPVYDEYGHQVIYTTGQLERFPITNTPTDNLRSPVACSNYPDHSSEGFKSFISVESCNQPSYLGTNGVPLFGNGCTFRYMCELGYQPLGGLSSSIKCSNGFWTARAVCIKQEISNSNRLTSIANQPQQQQQQGGILNKVSNQNQQSSILSLNQNGFIRRSDNQEAEVLNNGSNRFKRSSDYENEETSKDQAQDYQLVDNEDELKTTKIAEKETDTKLTTPKSILQKIFKAETTKKIEKIVDAKSNSDPSFDWSSILSNDSEKTIYESFYELLDNGFKNKNSIESNKKNKIKNENMFDFK